MWQYSVAKEMWQYSIAKENVTRIQKKKKTANTYCTWKANSEILFKTRCEVDWNWVKAQNAIMFVQTALNNDACMGFTAGSFKRAAILQSKRAPNSAKYLQAVTFSQFHLAEMADIKNLDRATS